jgi:hypothetical protein
VTRRYIKAQSIFANMGGFLKLLFLISHFITYLFSMYKKDLFILNSFIDYDLSSNSGATARAKIRTNQYNTNKKEKATPNEMNNSQTNTQLSYVNNFINETSYSVYNPKFKGKLSKNKFHSLSLTCVEIIKITLCRTFIKNLLNRKRTLYLRSKNIVGEKMDVIKLLKQVEDIENIKSILFNEQQMALFSLIEKPVCSEKGIFYPDVKHLNKIVKKMLLENNVI